MESSEKLIKEKLSLLLKRKKLVFNEDKTKKVLFTQPGQYIRYVGINIVHTEKGNVLTVGRSYIHETAKEYLDFSRRKSQYARNFKEINQDSSLKENYSHYLFYQGRRLAGKIQFIRQVEGSAGVEKLIRRLSPHLCFEGEKELVQYCMVKNLQEIEGAWIPLAQKKEKQDTVGQKSHKSWFFEIQEYRSSICISRFRFAKEGLPAIDTDVVVPEKINGKPVTSIGQEAFRECGNLKSVFLPNTVFEIGNEAFAGCGQLVKVNLPSSLQTIGRNAFAHCWRLSGITFPQTMKSIGAGAFQFCSNLTEAVIPSGVSEIGLFTFSHCSQLSRIEFQEGVKIIGEGAFEDCEGLISLVIPAGVREIEKSAFQNCKRLNNVKIVESDKGSLTIGEKAFCGCEELVTIYIPGHVTQIGMKALHMDRKIFSGPLPKVIIMGRTGSYAERYAKANKIRFYKLKTES